GLCQGVTHLLGGDDPQVRPGGHVELEARILDLDVQVHRGVQWGAVRVCGVARRVGVGATIRTLARVDPRAPVGSACGGRALAVVGRNLP
ncbi:hypothetical protein C1890_34065, partial [Pseudomonas sp. DP16D-R1]